jgi:MFS family permease
LDWVRKADLLKSFYLLIKATGNYVLLPIALACGRRPVFLVSMVVLLASTILAALQTSYEAHLAARIIQGLATGASESLLPLMLTEITFLHERSRVFGLYWMVQNMLSSTINLSSSYINKDLGWRWYYWVFVITVSVGLVIAFLFGFETQFTRSAASVDGKLIFTDEYGVTNIIPDDQAQEYFARMEREGMSLPSTDDGGNDIRKTYAQKLRPWSDVQDNPLRIMLLTYLHMLQSLTSPGIAYAILTSSIALGCGIGMSLTYNHVLMDNYGWAPQNIGLINIGGVIGALFGMLYCTFLGDPFVLFLARRNKGIHKPEHQLLALFPPAIIGMAMLLLYGFTAGGGATWWAPYIGWTIFQYTFTAVLIISTTFASEATTQHPGPALVVVVGTKNIVSFGVSYGLTPMVNAYGFPWAFGVLTAIFGAIFLLGIPVYYMNPKWRARQSSKKKL